MTSISPSRATADVGVVGLGVMGRNLALNLADHGYDVAGFDLDQSAVARLLAEDKQETPDGKPGAVLGCSSMQELIATLMSPRVIIVLVPAGRAVDAVCESLIAAGAEPDDIIVDTGNSLYTDTMRREQAYRGRITFFGSGVSGGELGARFGPSLMPGGDEYAWRRLEPIWEAIAARVDSATGKPIEGAAPGQPITGGEPCTAYIAPNGAGHYVKMVHNGIEYADMQLICEAYHLMRSCLGMQPREIGDVFESWNESELESYLIEITADILRQSDPITGKPLVDVILDAAGQKGTGRWTAINALELGVPATAISEAVFARALSAQKDQREKASLILEMEARTEKSALQVGIDAIRDALYCSKICAYAQGFQLMRAAADEYHWNLRFGEIASLWRGGCIIRARFLQKITDAFDRDASLDNLLLDPHFTAEVQKRSRGWRDAIMLGIRGGVPLPAFSSSLAWFDGFRSATLPANLLQAQRDYFGAHTYERVDQPRGHTFHIDWPDPNRPQIAMKH